MANQAICCLQPTSDWSRRGLRRIAQASITAGLWSGRQKGKRGCWERLRYDMNESILEPETTNATMSLFFTFAVSFSFDWNISFQLVWLLFLVFSWSIFVVDCFSYYSGVNSQEMRGSWGIGNKKKCYYSNVALRSFYLLWYLLRQSLSSVNASLIAFRNVPLNTCYMSFTTYLRLSSRQLQPLTEMKIADLYSGCSRVSLPVLPFSMKSSASSDARKTDTFQDRNSSCLTHLLTKLTVLNGMSKKVRLSSQSSTVPLSGARCGRSCWESELPWTPWRDAPESQLSMPLTCIYRTWTYIYIYLIPCLKSIRSIWCLPS